MTDKSALPWASARTVKNLDECYFYQAIDLPGIGEQKGEWDLRGEVDSYLGGVSVEGRRVLELGTANGFLCFEMERRGAEVVAHDLGEDDEWDLVPFDGHVTLADQEERRDLARRLNNAWWLTHDLLGSSAQVVYGSIYDMPSSVGDVDIATFGSILCHLRDPFLALHRVTTLVRETVIVTDVLPEKQRRSAGELFFLPDSTLQADIWWRLSPEIVSRFLSVLGFKDQRVTHHRQVYNNAGASLSAVVKPSSRKVPMYTLVASRREPRT